MNKPLLVIAMPVINKGTAIKAIAEEWLNLLDTFFAKNEETKLLLVDYGSTDNTVEVLKELKNKCPDKVEINNSTSAGFNNGLVQAYKHALNLNSEYVFQVNADERYSPDEFHKIWERGQIGKLIIGCRKNTKDNSEILKWVIKLVYGVLIKDASIPYRLYKSDYLKHLLSLLPNQLPTNPNTYFSILAKYSGEGLHNVAIDYKTNGSIIDGNTLKFSDIMGSRRNVKKNVNKLLDLIEAS